MSADKRRFRHFRSLCKCETQPRLKRTVLLASFPIRTNKRPIMTIICLSLKLNVLPMDMQWQRARVDRRNIQPDSPINYLTWKVFCHFCAFLWLCLRHTFESTFVVVFASSNVSNFIDFDVCRVEIDCFSFSDKLKLNKFLCTMFEAQEQNGLARRVFFQKKIFIKITT